MSTQGTISRDFQNSKPETHIENLKLELREGCVSRESKSDSDGMVGKSWQGAFCCNSCKRQESAEYVVFTCGRGGMARHDTRKETNQ